MLRGMVSGGSFGLRVWVLPAISKERGEGEEGWTVYVRANKVW